MTSVSTQEPNKLSGLWALSTLILGGAVLFQAWRYAELGFMEAILFSLLVSFFCAGVARSWLWTQSPNSQSESLWTAETLLMAAATTYFFSRDHSWPALAGLLAWGLHLVLRDYSAGRVSLLKRRFENERHQELHAILRREPAHIAETVQHALGDWRQELKATSEAMNQELLAGATAFKDQLAQVATDLGQALSGNVRSAEEQMTQLTATMWEERMKVSAQTWELGTQAAVKVWLDGAQEAAGSWKRAQETGVRCLADQMQGLAQQWEGQLALSRAWMEEHKQLLMALQNVLSRLDASGSEETSDAKQLATQLQQFSTSVQEFQKHFETTVSQLLHEQKEWTLGLFQQKRYLQIDQ